MISSRLRARQKRYEVIYVSVIRAAHHHVEEHGVKMVDLKFCDLWGRWHHLTIPAGQFTPHFMEEGVGFDGSAVGFGPIDANIFAWTDEQRAKIKSLPGSLEEALRALEGDHEFLLAGGVFTEELIQQWIRYKWEYEAYPVRNRPHPYEMSLYFDV
jgi:glutamine synthetase